MPQKNKKNQKISNQSYNNSSSTFISNRWPWLLKTFNRLVKLFDKSGSRPRHQKTETGMEHILPLYYLTALYKASDTLDLLTLFNFTS